MISGVVVCMYEGDFFHGTGWREEEEEEKEKSAPHGGRGREGKRDRGGRLVTLRAHLDYVTPQCDTKRITKR